MTDHPERRVPTLMDVADRAGVSAQTVSRVVNGQGPVAARTRARVMDAIGELNYVPNRLARGLARQRSLSIGFATNDISLHAPSQLASAIEGAARQAGYSLIVTIVAGYGLAPVTHALRALRERQVDGALINASLSPGDAHEITARFPDLPCVFMDVPPSADVPGALLDQALGARLGADHLLNLGHTRIACIDAPQGAVAEQARLRGWEDTLAARGLNLVARAPGDWSPASGYAATQTLLAGGVPFTALLVANDQMAVGALRALWERGVNVPADVSVVGYDDTAESALLIPPLTTVRQDFPLLGRRAFAHLHALLRGEDHPPTLSTPHLVVRASTAPPPGPERQDVQAALRTLMDALTRN
ncbi:LacI family DNA-binding transcriptional regulator [Deinococcus sp. JMULE3]|uniref:LacI family DNA-binding transcriptional regulator n=1 Tax=Deinococcus sp. JMULE3 TaxID=2518341 RepID=UPI00157608E6|nr:LacI family DNA-binding transcriptional regulator [Deinococcus sp. JMULE3]NTY01441.1 LacI family DNA-binding transcriptional regulator [Deinococcus sp. JMULE3]